MVNRYWHFRGTCCFHPQGPGSSKRIFAACFGLLDPEDGSIKILYTLLIIYQSTVHCETSLFIIIPLKCQISHRTLTAVSLKMIPPWVFHIFKGLIYLKPELHILYSDWAMVWMIWGSNPGWGKRLFLYTKMSRPPLGPTQTPIHWVPRGFLPKDKVAGV